MRFADDTVSVSLLKHDETWPHFINWCQEAFLELNVTKTKDMRIDFRHKDWKSPPATKTNVSGIDIEIVQQYKYVGSIIDNKLSLNCYTEMLCQKGQEHLQYTALGNWHSLMLVMISLADDSFLQIFD